jgi:hypothetical protein
MSNVNAPRGLTPVRHRNGAPYNGAARQYYHDSGNGVGIFIGDLVTATGGSTFVNLGGAIQSMANVVQSATGDVFQGVCVGVLQDNRDSLIYCAASTGRIILVADDPNLLFQAQETNSGTALTANDVELNINVVVGSGSTVTGFSAMTLDNSTEATTNTLDLKIIEQLNSPDNDPGASVSAGSLPGQFLVSINRHRFANQVAGV